VKVTATRRSGYVHDLTAGPHTIVTDEPESVGGTDTAPTPTQLLAMSLASCTATTVEMYADRKGWELGELEVEVDYELEPRAGRARFDVSVRLPADLSEEQAERMLVIAGKCPVHRVLCGEVEINDRVERV
jgi:putative redox protein